MRRFYFLFSISLFFITGQLAAIGTYAEGRAIMQIVKIESQGILFDSYEGEMVVASFDSQENCRDDACYTPQKRVIRFSVDIDNTALIQYLTKNLNRVALIDYRIHRIKSPTLGSTFEVTGAKALNARQTRDFAWKFVRDKTGSRNFSVYGKVLRLEYRGTFVGTYEGILYDRQADKIRPFSITDDLMAEHVMKAMESVQEYHIGISEAIVTGFRESDYDIFEINYKERAGGIVAE